MSDGTAVGSEQDTWALHPTYEGCEFFGEEMTFDTTGCDYLFDSDTSEGHADFAIACIGTGMVIESPVCTLVMGDQTTAPGVTYANVAKGNITVRTTVPDLEAHSWEGVLCELLVSEGTITIEMQGLSLVEGLTEAEAAATIAIGDPPECVASRPPTGGAETLDPAVHRSHWQL